MPNFETTTPISERYDWPAVIDAVDKNLAGRALYLTVEEPFDPLTALNLSNEPGILATHVDIASDISWQLWRDHSAAEKSYSSDPDNRISAHFSVIRGNEGVIFVPHTAA